jgi:hypothetical protein
VVVLLFVYGQTPFTSIVPLVVIVIAFLVLGVLWGLFAPARRARRPPPPASASEGSAEHTSS